MIDVEITAGRVVFEGRDAALILAHDVSERRRMEQRLVEAEKLEAVGRLAGGVAHDFNNLLTVIHGYASLLSETTEGETHDGLGEILHAAEQASALTRQLLAFSRRQVMHADVLDLNEIVAGMQPMLQRIIGDDVSIGVRLAPGTRGRGGRPRADRARDPQPRGQARDAMPRRRADDDRDRERRARRRLRRQPRRGLAGPHVMLAVSDTGVGMSEDVQRHLFEPFFTTKPAGAGTGLGLATVFGVVRQSGGSIYLYSEEGAGTTFKIYLPATTAERAGDARAREAPPLVRGTETILVVEDDPGVRDLVRIMLEASGYRVLSASSAAEAEEVCEAGGAGIDVRADRPR